MKILFVHQYPSSFVIKDIEIIKERNDIRIIEFPFNRYIIFRILPNLYKLIKGVIWCDVIFCWFGKLHAFFAVLVSKLFRKKTIVVAGGDDVAFVPEIKHGMLSFWWKRWCPLYVFRNSDMVIPVSKYSEIETKINFKINNAKIKTIYHGFSNDIFTKNHSIKKENIVITIGSLKKNNLIRKGLKLFIDSATYLPKIQFILIGPDLDGTFKVLRKISPPNVTFILGTYGNNLINLLNKAKIYVQASAYESFGCSIAESMLCECIPIVSDKGAIPEVVGDNGIYLNELTPENLAEKIEFALSLPDDFGQNARKRIESFFSIEKRKSQILNVIEEVYNA